jgi:hypothetical protein
VFLCQSDNLFKLGEGDKHQQRAMGFPVSFYSLKSSFFLSSKLLKAIDMQSREFVVYFHENYFNLFILPLLAIVSITILLNPLRG